jgi:chemosensory pili system protein ChpA (sensor histidine kinase/response regulator)
VVILQKAGQRMALHVDEIFGNQELVVKNLGPQLSGLPGLDGISALDSGALVLIYNPFVLADVYAKAAVNVYAAIRLKTNSGLEYRSPLIF